MKANWRFVSTCVLGAVVVFPLQAQRSEEATDRSRVFALEHAWNQAEAFKDMAALDAILDNGLTYVDSDGILMNKAGFLAHAKSEHMSQIITQSLVVKFFGDTAIVTGTFQSSEFRNGRPIVHRGRFVDAWVRKEQTWVCVAAQLTPTPR